MKILGIEHIGIATESIANASPFWKMVLGLDHVHSETIKREGVVTEIFEAGNGSIELLEPFDENSSVSKFLKKKGKGVHHICFQVDDINGAIKKLKRSNVRLVNKAPIKGAQGHWIIFIHPESTGGVLVELVEKR